MTKGQRFFILWMLISLFVSVCVSFGQTVNDTIITPRIVTVTVPVTHDTTYSVTVPVTHDSTYSYVTYDTTIIPVQLTLKGMYMHPNQCAIGNQTSENNFLSWCKREGVNMLNCYARNYLYDDFKRTQLAAFVKKAKENYGIVLVTVDVRFTNSSEHPGWIAYFAKYKNTVSMIEPLTEFEPWVYNTSTGYDYNGFFYLVRTMGNLCKSYGVKLNFYEGWVGNNYNGQSFSQAPVDSMVKYCDRIFISNYIKISDYNSTSTNLGKWDSRMDKRCGYIAVAVPRMGKSSMDIVEIQSLELIKWGAANDFLGTLYACPATSTNKCHSFYGSTYQDAQDAYNLSTVAVLLYTNLVGKTIFMSKYGQLAHP